MGESDGSQHMEKPIMKARGGCPNGRCFSD